MREGDHTLELPDGRRLGCAVLGDAQGHPVIYAHGFPASRLEARLVDGAARRAGVALVAADRPGFGLSDFQPGRRISDWADDVACLAERLGAPRLSLLGGSGGCPFALASAGRLGRRLVRVGIVAGLGPVDGGAVREMGRTARIGFALARRSPRAFALLYGALASVVAMAPDLVFRLNEATPPDAAVLADPEVRGILRASTREAFRRGTAGAVHEMRLLAGPWGFAPGGIAAPVTIWHGLEDGVVPVAMGRRLAAAIPGADLRLLAGEGHVSLPARRGEQILRELLP